MALGDILPSAHQIKKIAKQKQAKQYPRSPGARSYVKKTAPPAPKPKPVPPQRHQKQAEREFSKYLMGQKTLKPTKHGLVAHDNPFVKAIKDAKSGKNPALYKVLYPEKKPTTTLPIAGVHLPVAAVAQRIDKELSGSGVLASASRGLGNLLADMSASSAGSKSYIPGAQKVASNAVKDVVDLPANAPASVYLPGKAAVQAATGNTKPGKALVKQIKQTDPVALTLQGKIGKALKAAEAHPVYTALEARGAKAVLGRSTGAAMRAVPGPTRRLAATKRAPLKIHGNITEKRRYSPDILTKGAQKAIEGIKRKKGIDPNQASPRVVRKALKRRTDEEVALTEGIRRKERDTLMHEFLGKPPKVKGVRPTKTERNVAPLAVQRIVRSPQTLRLDLAKYRNQIKAERPNLKTKSERLANKKMLQQVNKALKTNVGAERVFAEADRYMKRHEPITKKLVKKGVLAESQAEIAPLIPYARTHMGAKYEKGTGLVTRQGEPLTASTIRAHMASTNTKEPGFITQKPGARGAKNFYINSQPRRQSITGPKRTGEATVRGTFDASHQAMAEHIIHDQGKLSAVEGFDRAIKTFGVRKPDGTFFKDFKDARKFLDEIAHDEHGHKYPEHVDLQPVRIAPFAASGEALAKIKAGHTTADELSPIAEHQDLAKRISDAYNESTKPGDGPVVLMPSDVIKRLQQHNRQTLPFEKAAQSLSTTFKGAVLPTSTKWMFGNDMELSVRSILNGLTPGHYVLGRRFAKGLKADNPKAAQELDIRALGGTHLSSVQKLQTHRSPESFGGGKLTTFAKAVEGLKATPGPKQVVGLWHLYRDNVFRLNSWIEKQPQYAALGKALQRELMDTTGKWHSALMVGDKAMQDLIRGAKNSNNQVAYGRYIDEIFGQWDKNSPATRKFLLDYAPFWMWARAASRFVLVTFPGKHPIKTGLLAAAATMTEPERKKLGLDWFSASPVPPFLQGSLPTIPLRRFQGYSSFGFFADYPSSISQQILPQFGGLNVLAGIDWKGDKLKNSDGSDLTPDQRLALAAYTQLEAWMPFISIGRRLREGGGSSQTGSTIFKTKVRPGTRGSTKYALNKIFNPLAPVNNSSKSKTGPLLTPPPSSKSGQPLLTPPPK